MSQCHYAFERGPMRQRGAALIVGLVLLVVVTLVGVGAMQSTTLQEKMAGNLRDSNLAFQASEAVLRHCENILVQDYALQVRLFGPPPPNLPVVNNPPTPPLLDQNWPLGGQTPLPSWLLLPAGMPATIWLWSLDNGQAGVLFPGLAANRLDPSPDVRPWWAEAANDNNWWQGAASNSQALPANTLDGLFADPRCILEGYIYAVADNSAEAISFRRSIPVDGLVIKNEKQFRRERSYFRNTVRGVGGSGNAVAMLQTGVYMIYHAPN